MTLRKLMAWLPVLLILLTVFSGCGKTEPPTETLQYNTVEDLTGKRIGVITGMILDQVAEKNIPDCRLFYYANYPDMAEAFSAGKIDAFLADEPIARKLALSYPEQSIMTKVMDDSYGFIFPKDEAHKQLCGEMNAFLAKSKEDGTLKELDDIWFGNDESRQVIDRTGLTGENGTIQLVASTNAGEPFVYVRNGECVGYEIDILYRFCRANGYALEMVDTNFDGILASISSGKGDIGASCISITEERKESMRFSDPHYAGGIVIVVQNGASDTLTFSDMKDKRIGVMTGSVFDRIAKEKVPGNKVEYLNAMSDMPTALQAGKIDAYLADEPVYRSISRNYPEEYVIEQLTYEEYAFLFPKNSAKHTKICKEMNEFLAASWNDGTIEALCDKWINGDYTKASVDFSGLTGENGTLKMAVCSEIGAPFTFMQNNKFAGYDIEVAVRFCQKYGYALQIDDYGIGGFLSAASTGNADFAAGCVSVTKERQESILFSDPDYHGGIVLVGAHTAASDKNGSDFLAGMAESFKKTFIRENRWKLFLDGIGITLIITALSVVFGTVVGFLLFLLYRKNFKPFVVLVDIIRDIFEKMPVVVLLMILYYVAFGKTDLSGVLVSVIGFSIMFAFSLVGTLKVGVNAVDKGQNEASLAMGFTDLQGFFKIILPQAAKHFLPGYKGQIVALLKDTAIVGYIAVQDLTKISDIVRSRTYEAFFPLIATAVLYFLLAWLLTVLVRALEIKTDTTKRSKKKILRGVKTE